ncbi:ATP-dependent protease ATPase subunit HslU [Xylocopilactobacillus apicola]|uniref:ATP-dependent protease ATPase subunit HslU n=1 Tax=Xylocopilactobacillus apicola TaxID=2932184 RepID=A0AAU9D8H6_9LACO|nr:ATP-dependent protease ATPase subunit HslU [Xylocopilactobacillus apicola]BDR58640.1 ATP-dependent protease ATPase subunit HslU [Xylocopilactobacillus apicola]
MNENTKTLTPKEIVSELDKYIVGQQEAKKAVAIAIFNRHRRLLLDRKWQEAITPKNLMMIGPTGVGKTEIARRLARVVGAPFIKVEATKFTEVGYVGRDVESMVRDLADIAANMIKKEKRKAVREQATKAANARLIKILSSKKNKEDDESNPEQSMMSAINSLGNIFGLPTNNSEKDDVKVAELTEDQKKTEEDKQNKKKISDQLDIADKLNDRELEDKIVTIKVKETSQGNPTLDSMGSMGVDMSETLERLVPPRYVERKMKVKEAREVLIDEETDKLIDSSDINLEAIKLAENSGIIFIDEFDKIANGNSHNTGEVSREGVQRDILPIVEGSQVKTKYGMVDTDHILFIASGAFEQSKPSDLIAELQGRFPIRVELNNLSEADFRRILTEPDDAIIKQYKELIKTDGVEIDFKPEAIDKIAQIAAELNDKNENIGARRLATVIEKLLEDILFETPGMNTGKIEITEQYVENKLDGIVSDHDLSEYIL